MWSNGISQIKNGKQKEVSNIDQVITSFMQIIYREC